MVNDVLSAVIGVRTAPQADDAAGTPPANPEEFSLLFSRAAGAGGEETGLPPIYGDATVDIPVHLADAQKGEITPTLLLTSQQAVTGDTNLPSGNAPASPDQLIIGSRNTVSASFLPGSAGPQGDVTTATNAAAKAAAVTESAAAPDVKTTPPTADTVRPETVRVTLNGAATPTTGELPKATLADITAALREQPVQATAPVRTQGIDVESLLPAAKQGVGEISTKALTSNTVQKPQAAEGPVLAALEGRPLQTATGETITIRPAAAAPNATRPEAFQQVADHIRIQTTDQKVNLRLDPPELGRVGIDLTFDNHRLVTATLSAESADTAHLLRRSMDSLQRELSAAGFEGVNIEFSDHAENTDSDDVSPWTDMTVQSSPMELVTQQYSGGAPLNVVTTERIDARF